MTTGILAGSSVANASDAWPRLAALLHREAERGGRRRPDRDVRRGGTANQLMRHLNRAASDRSGTGPTAGSRLRYPAIGRVSAPPMGTSSSAHRPNTGNATSSAGLTSLKVNDLPNNTPGRQLRRVDPTGWNANGWVQLRVLACLDNTPYKGDSYGVDAGPDTITRSAHRRPFTPASARSSRSPPTAGEHNAVLARPDAVIRGQHMSTAVNSCTRRIAITVDAG